MTDNNKKTVLVAMSGGVDSSVALINILKMGYNAIGVTMKLWEYKDVGGAVVDESSCCGIDEINAAKLVCDRMNVPHYTIDFQKVFKEQVIDNFADEYLKGRTPNPCVRCNSFVKWDAFIDQADSLGADYIATGHYAIINEINGEKVIMRAKDDNKDQSYVLWGIPSNTISRTLLPLGDLTKPEVREIARKNNLDNAEAPESMEICFVADNNYKRFLRKYVPKKMDAVPEGVIEDEHGEKVGTHPGYTHYTIGQRKGIGLSYSEPRYVKTIDSKSNKITISKKESLYSNECYVSDTNWLTNSKNFPMNIQCQIRYNSKPHNAHCIIDKDRIKVTFDNPQLAVTPGQSIVFFDNDILLGGGIIEIE